MIAPLSAAIVIGPVSVSLPASAQSGSPTVPAPAPCIKEPCGLAIGGGRSRPINLEPMTEEARAFVETKLVRAISRRVATSDYFRSKKAERHCRGSFRIVIEPSRTVGFFALQEMDTMFVMEFMKIVRDTVENWKGRFPDDVFDKPFMMAVGYGLLPCRQMR